ncbi:MAG: FlgD immunoglobulin-like domain containing protein, partial [Candidatus Poribacteria bacterium]
EVLFSPDFEAVGFFSKTDAVTLGEGPYAGYVCVGHIEASLGPDPENPGEFIVHGVGEAILEKVSSAITEVPEEDYTRVFFASLSSGLNMISLPLKPVTSYTARSFAEYLGSTIVIKLDEKRQRFVGFTIDDPDDGFPIEGGKGYIVNVEESKVVSFVGAAWTNQPPVSASPPVVASDATWAFVLSGYLQSESEDGYAVKARNLRTGATAIDTVVDGHFAAVWADLSRNSVVQEGDKLEVALLSSAGEVIAKTVFQVRANDIRRAFAKITLERSHFIPRSFALLQNYPNPFNPETWIPYQLAENANVHISIYNSAGQLVRVLSIGEMQAGSYLTKGRAAYWDGRNERGERVGSGVYFYHLRAGDFQATRRMLIVK